jgi:exosortase A-associated hydrolase 1
MALLERALSWSLSGDELVGVLAAPAVAALPVGVLIVVGGPQCRTGSHRMFTQLARELAAQGVASLRFDVRGMGDSSGAQRGFEQLSDDIGSAIDTLMAQRPDLHGVVLWGLCDAASAALLYVDERRDARVRGLCLANPWLRSAASQARTQLRHYYWDRLRQPAFWRKLLGGGVGLGALRDWWQARRLSRAQAQPVAAMGFQDRMARGWRASAAPKLLLLSGNDYTAREFEDYAGDDPAWAMPLRDPVMVRLSVADADHTFSDPAHWQAAIAASADWVIAHFSSKGDTP